MSFPLPELNFLVCPLKLKRRYYAESKFEKAKAKLKERERNVNGGKPPKLGVFFFFQIKLLQE